MNKAWNVMKKGFDKKTTNLKEPILNPMRRSKRLVQRITTLYENDRVETMKSTKKGEDNSKRTQTITKSPLNADYQNESQSDLVLKTISDTVKEGTDQDEKKSISSQQKQTVARKRKRCQFCRKRGHLQKDCVSKHMFRKWLRAEVRDILNNMR